MRLLGVPVLAAGIFGVSAAGHAASQELRPCDALLAVRPDDEETARCFFDLGKKKGFHGEVTRRLEGLLAKDPERSWLRLFLGYLEELGGADRALVEAKYRSTAGEFTRRGTVRGEALARIDLHRILTDQGHYEEASFEGERTKMAVKAAGDPLLLARADIGQALERLHSGEDLGEAYALLHHAGSILARNRDHQHYDMVARQCLRWLGSVGTELGLLDEAHRHYEHLLLLARRSGKDDAIEASARYGLARIAVERLAEQPDQRREATARRLAEEALRAGQRIDTGSVATLAHWMLAQLTSGMESREHLDRCLAEAPVKKVKSSCLNALARQMAATDPRRAEEAAAQALALAEDSGDLLLTAAAKATRMRVRWVTALPKSALDASEEALDAIEELRDLQVGPVERPGLFSTWSDDYAWAAGRLLTEAGSDSDRIERAFLIQERQRARTLLDALTRAGAAPVTRRRLEERNASLERALARVRQRAADAEMPTSEREHARRDLAQLELRRAALEDQLARAGPAPPGSGSARFVQLSDLQGALAEDEALLSFQVAPWKDWTGDFGGGSWLVVVARGAVPRIYRLMGREELREEVCHFARLVAPVQQPCGRRMQRNITRNAQAARLYRQLLGDALDELPAGIRRLVVIPDDALYRLPFAALRASEGAEPLGSRFQISMVPSATLALRWRRARAAPGEVPLFAVANPPEPDPAQRARLRRAGIPLPLLPDLPDSVREARAAVRALGRDSVLRGEGEVSEQLLKNAARDGGLRRFAILHFAGHAIVDDRRFQSSGLWLSPGAPKENGLLQIQEIVGLDLDGRIVVLAACRSASGAVLRGEGVMSLARAFFQAGAHTVVGSLWPLRDEDGEAFFGRFYHHLARGLSVAEALQAAQRDRIADGAPEAAWSGLVVLGNGDLVPLPGGRSLLERHGAILLASCGALLLLFALLALARRRQPS